MRENLDQRVRPGELPGSKLELYFITSQRKVKLWYYNLYKRQQIPFPCPAIGNFPQVKGSTPAHKKRLTLRPAFQLYMDLKLKTKTHVHFFIAILIKSVAITKLLLNKLSVLFVHLSRLLVSIDRQLLPVDP
jgi:hypothetical protein